MQKEEYLTKKYDKWNNFKDDSDSDNENTIKVPTQFDIEGDADIIISNEMLLTSGQIEKYKKLDIKEQEVWQVVVRKLRVWTATDSEPPVPCRPYCIMVNNLYPLGQVVSKRICSPPEVYPSAEIILNDTLKAMIDPPTSTPQHRPGKINFPDKTFVGKLRKSYAAIGIECTYLSESDGIDSFVSEMSRQLVEKDLANVAEVSLRPGFCTGEGVNADVLKSFYKASAKYASCEPWNHIPERQAIQIDAKQEIRIDRSHCADSSTVFSSVINSRSPNGDVIHGLALFFTRADLENRVIPDGEKLAFMENPSLRRCGYCDKKAAKGKELKKCTRCKCTFYCDANCQRGHWKEHKLSCVPETEVKQSLGTKWGKKEITIIYDGLTSMTFDDLDAIDRYDLPITLDLYPSVVTFKSGSPEVPNASDLVWLTRALHAFIELIEHHPTFLRQSLVNLIGLDGLDEDVTRVTTTPSIEVQWNSEITGSEKDNLLIKNSTVLTTKDVEQIRDAVNRQKEKVANGETTKNEETKDDDEGACCLM